MKKAIMAIVLAFGLIGSASALPALGGAIHFLASHGVVAYAVLNPELRECDKQPNVLAKRPGESYNFEVTACEMQSNDKLVEVK